ncbi:MAG: hypothetical protein OXC57_10555 [Rhodobacteraceae bacterium]|nr:hypothetical protein [Paracoccaceae bacterium]
MLKPKNCITQRKENQELKGSAELLSKAIQQVLKESMQSVRDDIEGLIVVSTQIIADMKDDLIKEINETLKQTTRDFHSYMAKQVEIIANIVDKKMQRKSPTRKTGKITQSAAGT